MSTCLILIFGSSANAEQVRRDPNTPVASEPVQSTPAERVPRGPGTGTHLTVAVGGDYGLASGGCEDSVAAACQPALSGFRGLYLAPAVRVSPSFSVGVLGAFNWQTRGGQLSQFSESGMGRGAVVTNRMLRTTVLGTYFPVPRAGLWLGAEAGVVTILQSRVWSSVPAPNVPLGTEDRTKSAAGLGAGIGYQGWFTSWLGAGGEVRALVTAGDMKGYLRSDPVYSVGLSLVFGIPL